MSIAKKDSLMLNRHNQLNWITSNEPLIAKCKIKIAKIKLSFRDRRYLTRLIVTKVVIQRNRNLLNITKDLWKNILPYIFTRWYVTVRYNSKRYEVNVRYRCRPVPYWSFPMNPLFSKKLAVEANLSDFFYFSNCK